MNSPPTYPARIRRLLQTHTVMTVDQLRQALHGRSRSSVFRDLEQLQVITSYSHTGRYHALQAGARFDPHGLWFFNDIGFARYGTLKATLVGLIAQAQDGFTHKELKSRLRVAVQNALTDLVMSHTVGAACTAQWACTVSQRAGCSGRGAMATPSEPSSVRRRDGLTLATHAHRDIG